ncbi:hypothetical protein GCM10010234_27870 [Streptomyces hawaiiensis]
MVGLVQGLSGSGNSGFGAAASPGAAESTTAAVVIADRRAVLCVLRARHRDVLCARECISFPHGSQAERVTKTVTSATQAVTRSAQIDAVCPRTHLACGLESALPLPRAKPARYDLNCLVVWRNARFYPDL